MKELGTIQLTKVGNGFDEWWKGYCRYFSKMVQASRSLKDDVGVQNKKTKIVTGEVVSVWRREQGATWLKMLKKHKSKGNLWKRMVNSVTVALTNHFLFEFFSLFLSKLRTYILTDVLTDRMNDERMNEGPRIHTTIGCILTQQYW